MGAEKWEVRKRAEESTTNYMNMNKRFIFSLALCLVTGVTIAQDTTRKQSVEIIASFIDEIVKQYPIDPNNVTLIGFSQGAILSYATALTYPEKVTKVVALSGYFNQEIMPDEIDKNAISHLKFFVSHGSVDQVIPVDWARKAKPALENLGLDVVYNEYPVGHGVAPQNFFDFKNWLQK